jgi:hypothetical protein
MNVGELIDALGGRILIANALGKTHQAVSNWRKFNAIPPEHALDFQVLCQDHRLRFDPAWFKRLTNAERAQV